MNSTDPQTEGTRPDQVFVELSECTHDDAGTVLGVLTGTFACDRTSEEEPHEASGGRPTVWAVTVDAVGDVATPSHARLRAPVTVDLQGGYIAVDRLVSRLSDTFTTEIMGSASGDQEKEVGLRLTA